MPRVPSASPTAARSNRAVPTISPAPRQPSKSAASPMAAKSNAKPSGSKAATTAASKPRNGSKAPASTSSSSSSCGGGCFMLLAVVLALIGAFVFVAGSEQGGSRVSPLRAAEGSAGPSCRRESTPFSLSAISGLSPAEKSAALIANSFLVQSKQNAKPWSKRIGVRADVADFQKVTAQVASVASAAKILKITEIEGMSVKAFGDHIRAAVSAEGPDGKPCCVIVVVEHPERVHPMVLSAIKGLFESNTLAGETVLPLKTAGIFVARIPNNMNSLFPDRVLHQFSWV